MKTLIAILSLAFSSSVFSAWKINDVGYGVVGEDNDYNKFIIMGTCYDVPIFFMYDLNDNTIYTSKNVGKEVSFEVRVDRKPIARMRGTVAASSTPNMYGLSVLIDEDLHRQMQLGTTVRFAFKADRGKRKIVEEYSLTRYTRTFQKAKNDCEDEYFNKSSSEEFF